MNSKIENRVNNIVNINKEQSAKIEQLEEEVKKFPEAQAQPITKFESKNCDFVASTEVGLKQQKAYKSRRSRKEN